MNEHKQNTPHIWREKSYFLTRKSLFSWPFMEKPYALDLVGWEGIRHTELRRGWWGRHSRQRQVCEGGGGHLACLGYDLGEEIELVDTSFTSKVWTWFHQLWLLGIWNAKHSSLDSLCAFSVGISGLTFVLACVCTRSVLSDSLWPHEL